MSRLIDADELALRFCDNMPDYCQNCVARMDEEAEHGKENS